MTNDEVWDVILGRRRFQQEIAEYGVPPEISVYSLKDCRDYQSLFSAQTRNLLADLQNDDLPPEQRSRKEAELKEKQGCLGVWIRREAEILSQPALSRKGIWEAAKELGITRLEVGKEAFPHLAGPRSERNLISAFKSWLGGNRYLDGSEGDFAVRRAIEKLKSTKK